MLLATLAGCPAPATGDPLLPQGGLTLPDCADGQTLTFSAGALACGPSIAELAFAIPSLPGCSDQELLSSNGQTLTCVAALNNMCMCTAGFAAAVNYPSGDSPTGAALADLDKDGSVDLVTANFTGDNLSFLKGSGNGSFAAKVDIPLSRNAAAVKVGDLNDDGFPDLVVASYVNALNAAGVVVLLNNKTTPFGATTSFDAPVFYPADSTTSTVDLTLADVNKDNLLDIVAANDNVGGVVTVYLNQVAAKGAFDDGVNYDVVNRPRTVLVHDFNADGTVDLLATNLGDPNVSLLLGNGDGTFQTRTDYATGSGPFGAILADFNADGKPDVVTANFFASDVSVLLSSASGTFPSHVEYPVGNQPAWVAALDVDKDLKVDIVSANSDSTSNSVSLLIGKGDGTFNAKIDYVVGMTPQHVLLEDVNKDGKPDIVVANVGSDNVSVLLNTTVCVP